MILGQLIQKYNDKIVPLLLPTEVLKGPASANVSIINVNNKLLINIRNLNYVLYHAENLKNSHSYGPLLYLHPEHDRTLTTYNYLCELDKEYNINAYSLIDTSLLDVKPLWEFIGLEDGRLAYWDNKLFLCGVRRDTTTNGQGRMELSEIQVIDNVAKEIDRTRIPAPGLNDSYCEKNWMPILDQPYIFIKWSNPTEVVKFNKEDNTTSTLTVKNYQNFNTNDLRGGSQLIPYKDYYIAIVHEVYLYQTETDRKDGTYKHRVVLWDKDFNLLKVSPAFSFLNAKIEFCCGLCEYNDKFIVTFGFQDNAAFLCEINKNLMEQLIGL